MKNRLERVHIASLRVALMASAVFVVLYTVIAAVIVVVVTNSLTSQVDARLASYLGQPTSTPTGPLSPDEFGGPRFAPTVYAWAVESDGTVVPLSNRWGALPQSVSGVGAPQTVNIQGTELRIAGTSVNSGYLVQTSSGMYPVSRIIVGETLATAAATRGTIIETEAIVGAVMLAVAFVGALIGGRRVGAPIELARQRQMEFTADASHELRTPLSVIEAQTSLALAQDRDTAWYRNAFQRVGNESRRIRRLVEDLLWLARVDAEPAQARGEAVEVGVLAGQTVDRFNAVAESRRLTLTLQANDEPHMVTASPEWLDRLLGVLIDNACKYTPEAGSVRVSVINDGNRVRVIVEDSGPGIPPEERPRIFERFHRATSRHGGAGLGLAIADAVVRRTHGRWEVGTSALLGGASVAVSWPRSGGSSRDAVRMPDPAAAPAPPPV